MKPFSPYPLLQTALIVIAMVLPAIAAAEPKQEIHRVGVRADDGSGWHLAVSTKGSFSALLPLPFNDFTIGGGATEETTHVVGGKSTEGIKFAVTEIAPRGKTLPDLASVPKSLATAANTVSDVSHTRKGDADILTLTVSNATTILYMRCIELGGVRYIMTIESPNAYREFVAANKDKFFDSFKLKAKS